MKQEFYLPPSCEVLYVRTEHPLCVSGVAENEGYSDELIFDWGIESIL